MGWIPTHGPSCVKVISNPTKCRYCGTPVVYIECCCKNKSKVYLNQDYTGKHHCARMPKNEVKISKKDAAKVISEFDFVASSYGGMGDDGRWRTKHGKGRQKRFHRRIGGCKYADGIQGERRVFKSEKEAMDEGYRRCKLCFGGNSE